MTMPRFRQNATCASSHSRIKREWKSASLARSRSFSDIKIELFSLFFSTFLPFSSSSPLQSSSSPSTLSPFITLSSKISNRTLFGSTNVRPSSGRCFSSIAFFVASLFLFVNANVPGLTVSIFRKCSKRTSLLTKYCAHAHIFSTVSALFRIRNNSLYIFNPLNTSAKCSYLDGKAFLSRRLCLWLFSFWLLLSLLLLIELAVLATLFPLKRSFNIRCSRATSGSMFEYSSLFFSSNSSASDGLDILQSCPLVSSVSSLFPF